MAPPVYRYRAACGEYLQHPLDASLRPIFVQQLRADFIREDVPHFIIFDRPYLTWFSEFDSLNWEWRYAFRIASGQTGKAPPPAIQRLVATWEMEHGEKLVRNGRGAVEFDELKKLDQCAVKRAALTFADGD